MEKRKTENKTKLPEELRPVPDVIAPGLTILFIGFNPGIRSALDGHHFAGPSNRFWKLLAESGLTPYRLNPEEDISLPKLGFGITNIVARPTRAAAEITKEEFTKGRKKLIAKLKRFKPLIACYEGIGVYREAAQAKEVVCGRQAGSLAPGVIDFVVSSPSGPGRIPYAEQLKFYIELKALAEETRRKE
jgi:TDG/mug DNA glycosylase family protein